MCAGAAIVRPEQAITNAVGHAIFHGPRHRICIVAIGKNIAELCLAIDQLTNGTEQESHALGTGAGRVGAELAVTGTGGDALAQRPADSFGVVRVLGNICHVHSVIHHGRTGSAPQESDDLSAGAGLIRPKETVADTAGNALFLRPLHSLIVIGAGGHIAERACLNFLDKGSINLDLAGGHGKGIFAVALVGQLQLLTILVGNGEVIQFETIVRLDGDCHGITTLGVAAVGCYLAVPDVLVHLDGIGGSVVVATGGRLFDQRCNGIFNGFCHCVNFGLLCDILAAHNSIKCCFHSGKIYIIVLVQSIRLCNGFVNLSVVCVLVLQGSNRIFDGFRHGVNFGLLCKRLASHHIRLCVIERGNRFIGVRRQIWDFFQCGINCGVIRRLRTAKNLSVHKRPSVAVVAAIQRGCKSFVFHFILRLCSCRFVLVLNTAVFLSKIAVGYFASIVPRPHRKSIPTG